MTQRFDFAETHADCTGWTRQHLAQAVQESYRHIYAAEEDTQSRDPGRVPGLLNRERSDGAYGIWGDDLGDLMLEGADRQPDGTSRIVAKKRPTGWKI